MRSRAVVCASRAVMFASSVMPKRHASNTTDARRHSPDGSYNGPEFQNERIYCTHCDAAAAAADSQLIPDDQPFGDSCLWESFAG